jgi:(p)ppGpp synthase/HD superfamily hydrolase
MAEWTKRKHSKGEIDRAASGLIPWWIDDDIKQPENVTDLWNVVENWRTSHGLPLNVFQAGLRSRAKRVDDDILVAQRLKRMASVLNKLVRDENQNMKLSQMHDLGGCRAILPTVQAVDELYGMYRGDEPPRSDEGSLKCYDYIRSPKDDGYRGIHIVGRYHAHTPSRESWNGQRIEIQLRSRVQHASQQPWRR